MSANTSRTAPPDVVAAGAVVLRSGKREPEVLVVHRPRYRDWSLPKGKLDAGESAPVAAVREVLEETGVTIRLGEPLGEITYPVAKGTKVVHWWVGHVLRETSRRPDDEVDKVVWLPVAEAAELLTYPDEHEMVERARTLVPGGTLLVVRHAKAKARKAFAKASKGKSDADRPLSRRGESQAGDLVPLLAAYGVAEVVSSSSKRCRDTLAPYGAATKLPVRRVDLLSEESGEIQPRQVRAYLGRLRAHAAQHVDRPLAICGHRPVLPDMLAGIGIPDRPMQVAEVVVVHLDAKGRVRTVEDWPPAS